MSRATVRALRPERPVARFAAAAPGQEVVVERGLRVVGHVLHEDGAPLAIDREAQPGDARVARAVRRLGLEDRHRVDLHRPAAHHAGTRVQSAAEQERLVEQPRDLAPRLGDVVRDRPLEVLRGHEAGPSLVPGGLATAPGVGRHRAGEREGHVGVAHELAARVALERQPVGRDQDPIRQLRDPEAVVGQGLGVVEERPAR